MSYRIARNICWNKKVSNLHWTPFCYSFIFQGVLRRFQFIRTFIRFIRTFSIIFFSVIIYTLFVCHRMYSSPKAKALVEEDWNRTVVDLARIWSIDSICFVVSKMFLCVIEKRDPWKNNRKIMIFSLLVRTVRYGSIGTVVSGNEIPKRTERND